MSEDVWQRLGAPAKVIFLKGEGPHRNKIAVEADESVDAYKVQRAHSRSHVRVVPIARAKVGLPVFEPIAVRFTIKAARLTITLPSVALTPA